MEDESAERAFARRMRQERQRLGWRQEDLAVAVAGHGVRLHASAFAKMERESGPEGSRMIRLNEAVAISQALGIAITDPAVSAAPCSCCSGTPPRGMICRYCGAGGAVFVPGGNER